MDMERTRNVGHITSDFYSVNQSLKQFFYAELVSIELEDQEGDYCYQRSLESALEGKSPQAIVIRTLPNDTDKLSRKYSIRTLLLAERAALFLLHERIQHLLIDLPSVDKRTKTLSP
jgi:kynurenine formamidase